MLRTLLIWGLLAGLCGGLLATGFSEVAGEPAVNQAINFTDTSSPQATSWLWIFDDGGTATVQSPSHTFTAAVSHELRTPVTVVKGFAEMLTAQRKSLNSRQFEAAEVISESAGHLQKMINDLLDLSKIEAGRLELAFTSVSLIAGSRDV